MTRSRIVYAPRGIRERPAPAHDVDADRHAPRRTRYRGLARRKQPLAGGFIDPTDVARAAVFLLSDDSSRVTGQLLTVDAGWSVTTVEPADLEADRALRRDEIESID
jgi:NAD(P)-dependent dehydrogenase (short-subunit alcohol dehydrogenase family)